MASLQYFLLLALFSFQRILPLPSSLSFFYLVLKWKIFWESFELQTKNPEQIKKLKETYKSLLSLWQGNHFSRCWGLGYHRQRSGQDFLSAETNQGFSPFFDLNSGNCSNFWAVYWQSFEHFAGRIAVLIRTLWMVSDASMLRVIASAANDLRKICMPPLKQTQKNKSEVESV